MTLPPERILDDTFGLDDPPLKLNNERYSFVCLKWGDEFGPEYVNRLQAMVAKHFTLPHDFWCIEDDASSKGGFHHDIQILSLDDIEAPKYPTWWGKVLAFSDMIPGRKIVLDLDTVIIDNIDWLADYHGDFAVLRGFGWPFRYGSALMSIAPNFGRYVWEEYERDPDFARMTCGRWGDGHWMQLCIGQADRWQDLYPGKVVSYKADCLEGVPRGATIVCFHGKPRPHECGEEWVQKYWIGMDKEEAAA